MSETNKPLALEAKELDTKDRNKISDSQFAFPRERKLPIHDASHVRNALARFNQTQGMSPEEKSAAWARIKRAAKKFGIEVKAESDEGEDATAEIHAATSWLMAAGIDLPHVEGHPNRMPFKGILTRIGSASDRPPHGALGKRVLLTQEAAEGALNSLLGMAVDLTSDFSGHDATKKIGIITHATIDGDALRIEGFIYASDFPREALRIHLDQADLGFSFEAQNLRVETIDADPLVIKSCMFTGAAILLKNQAAYETTALAAARAKEYEMDEVKQAVEAALEAALGPVAKTLSDIAATQAAQAQQLEDLKRAPVQANAATMSRVEPHASRLEAAANSMEHDGIGLHEPMGHAHYLRRMAHAMRADAARGKIPHDYHDGGSYFASGMPGLPQIAAPVQAQAAQTPAPQKIEETAEFKLMKASFETQLQRAKEDGDVLKTQMADLQQQISTIRPAPQRKTITPEIQQLLARAGVGAPEMVDGTITVDKLDSALAGTSLNTGQRMHLKTALSRAGVLQNGLPVANQ